MSCRRWSPSVPLLAACAALAALALPAVPAPAPKMRRPNVELLFVVDTTGSMSGIEDMKLKMWNILNQVAAGKPSPQLRVGLLNYKDKGDVWVTKIFDLTDDLDAVFSEFKTYTADGGGDGPEAVNQALDEAVNKVKWSEDKKTLKVIYLIGDAEPHMDYTDDVKYPITCKKAVAKGIIINAVQVGNDANCMKYWKEIADLGGGQFVQLPYNLTSTAITTPHDRKLSEINSALAKGILVWGAAAKKEADTKKINDMTALGTEAAADRAGFMAKEGRVASFDLLESLRAGKVKLASLKDDEFPTEMQKMTLKERRDYLDKIARKRVEAFRDAADLDKKRGAIMLKEMAKTKDRFDVGVLEPLRKQAKKFKIDY